jgi:hypothetical protein
MTTHLFPRPEEKMKEFWRSLLLLTVVTAVSCVTINIYFPAAAAEKAADRIIDEVWKLREGAAGGGKPASNEEAK